MVSSRWQKQNAFILFTGLVITTVILLLLWALFFSLGLERHWLSPLISTLALTVGLALTFTLKNYYAKSMVRILRLEYEAAEWAIRMVFKDKHIRFHRQTEEESYEFEFPGQSLILTIQPYAVESWVLERQMKAQPATKVALHELNAKNKAFANMLAESIDEIADQRANHWNKE